MTRPELNPRRWSNPAGPTDPCRHAAGEDTAGVRVLRPLSSSDMMETYQ
jgi:hypothetical protein